MSDDQKDAIEQLERRVATLENLLRRLTFVTNTSEQLRSTLTPAPRSAAKPSTFFPTVKAAKAGGEDLEQWFGQRGLLAVGVAALLIATGLFLKYAFDRGWIPPLVRSVSAVVVGIGVAAWGHERIVTGMRRYGAAMIGAGGGLVYLGLWAAAGPYALIEARVGILLLAATTVAVTYLAMHHEIEGLAIWALGGAYLAPIILATAPNPLGFLTYLEVIGFGAAITAYAMGWRATFNLAVFGYLLLAAAGAAAAIATPLGCWLIAAGAILTLHTTRQRSWPETRSLALLVAWSIIGYGLAGITTSQASRWLALGSAALVWALLFGQQALRDPFNPAAQGLKTEDMGVERFLFIASPAALLILANAVELVLLKQSFELVPLTLAVAYFTLGWFRRSAAHLITGFMLVALAMAVPWQARTIVIGWMGLALVALAAEREAARPGGRHAATTLALAAWICLFTAAMVERAFSGSDGGVLTGRWALALYVYVVGTAVLARWWGREDKPMAWNWLLCGAAVFTGGSILLHDYFSSMTALAGDLALSVWWLLFAGALVSLGFRLNHKLIRSTGLGVAAFAGLKIVLYDLSQMKALYRVGSFFALAIIALAVAYAYNRRAKVSVA